MARRSNSNLISAVLYLVIGALLIAFRSQMLTWAMTAIGVIFIVSGVLELLKRHLLGGLVSIGIGVAILVLGWTITSIVLLVLGILIAVKGLMDLLRILSKNRKTVAEILFPVITMVVGVVIAFGNALEIAIIVGGALLIVDGVVGIIAYFKR